MLAHVVAIPIPLNVIPIIVATVTPTTSLKAKIVTIIPANPVAVPKPDKLYVFKVLYDIFICLYLGNLVDLEYDKLFILKKKTFYFTKNMIACGIITVYL